MSNTEINKRNRLFSSEKEMQLFLENIDFIYFKNSQQTLVRRELSVGPIIPDLVHVNILREPQNLSLPSNWSYELSYMIWLIRVLGNTYPSTLARKSFLPNARISQLINKMIDSDLPPLFGPVLMLV